MYHHLPGGLPQHHLPFRLWTSEILQSHEDFHLPPPGILTWSGSARDSAYVSVPPPSQGHQPAWCFYREGEPGSLGRGQGHLSSHEFLRTKPSRISPNIMFHQPKLAITYLTGSLHSTPSWWFKLDNEFPGYDLFSLQISARHISPTRFLFPMKSFTKTWKNSACCTPIFTRLLCIYLCREWSCLQAAKVNHVPEASKELSFEGW